MLPARSVSPATPGPRRVLARLGVASLLCLALAAEAWSAGAARSYSNAPREEADPTVYDDPHVNAAFPDLVSLSRYLLLVASRISRYPLPDALPMVTRIPRADLEARGCPEGTRKCQVAALYEPTRGVMIAEDLSPETNLFHRSILFHELVHYLQEVGHELASAAPCERWYQRELEAYALQNRFLTNAYSPDRVSYSGARPTCDVEGDGTQTHRARGLKAPGVTD